MLDYTGFYEFPFPSSLAENDIAKKEYFFALPDDAQLELLNGSNSYESFLKRVGDQMLKN